MLVPGLLFLCLSCHRIPKLNFNLDRSIWEQIYFSYSSFCCLFYIKLVTSAVGISLPLIFWIWELACERRRISGCRFSCGSRKYVCVLRLSGSLQLEKYTSLTVKSALPFFGLPQSQTPNFSQSNQIPIIDRDHDHFLR